MPRLARSATAAGAARQQQEAEEAEEAELSGRWGGPRGPSAWRAVCIIPYTITARATHGNASSHHQVGYPCVARHPVACAGCEAPGCPPLRPASRGLPGRCDARRAQLFCRQQHQQTSAAQHARSSAVQPCIDCSSGVQVQGMKGQSHFCSDCSPRIKLQVVCG